MIEATLGFLSKIIAANPASDNTFIAQKVRHVRKIRGRAAKLAALRKNIPEQFAESDRRELFHGRPAFLWQSSTSAKGSKASFFVPANAFGSPVLMPYRAQFPDRERKHFPPPFVRIQLNSIASRRRVDAVRQNHLTIVDENFHARAIQENMQLHVGTLPQFRLVTPREFWRKGDLPRPGSVHEHLLIFCGDPQNSFFGSPFAQAKSYLPSSTGS